MGAPEACCERVGNIMESLRNKRPHLALSTLIDPTVWRDSALQAIGGGGARRTHCPGGGNGLASPRLRAELNRISAGIIRRDGVKGAVGT